MLLLLLLLFEKNSPRRVEDRIVTFPAKELHRFPAEHFPELVPSEHVDDKVAGRVDGQQQVAQRDDLLDLERRRAAVFLRVIAKDGFVNVGHDFHALAHDEHYDDADEHQSHVHLFPLGLHRGGSSGRSHLFLQFHRCADSARVVKTDAISDMPITSI